MNDSRRIWLLALLATLLATACNPVFDIHQGKPRPQCVDSAELLIDDMEDGDRDICDLGGRKGAWYSVGDGSSSDLTAGSMLDFKPSLIPGGRGSSRYASRFEGAGFTDWGALMGLDFNAMALASEPYDASITGGIKFWIKSNVAVSVNFKTPDTVLPNNGGDCDVSSNDPNCNNDFAFQITAPLSEWTEVQVPFSALTQPYGGGTASLNTQRLLGVNFLVAPGQPFDVWIDDLSFNICPTPSCVPTCSDPAFPVACPVSARNPARCLPPDIKCADAKNWCVDPLLIDDMEDGDPVGCRSGGRGGYWYVAGDGTSTDLSPGDTFTQTLIPEGRESSHHAARLSGSGFTDWGALMGLAFKSGIEPYDASRNGGIRFWLKSDVQVYVSVSTPETVAVEYNGKCVDEASAWNCYNDFGFFISQTSPEQWVEYKVPFAALAQGRRLDADYNFVTGSAAWDPARVVELKITSHAGAGRPTPGAPFETWVDDVQFYTCGGANCVPTCGDPKKPVACPVSAAGPAGCWIAGTDCSQIIGGSLVSVWGSGPDDVWTVGVKLVDGTGILRHWNGSRWSAAESDTAVALWSVSGGDRENAWAIGDHGSIVLWDGAAWHAKTTGTQVSMNAVWGSGPSDIWAIANPSLILHFDGASWSTSDSGSEKSLWKIWGSGPADVWAVGDGGTARHWDGSAWSTRETETDAVLYGVWGSDPHDVWAVGEAGTLTHWNGSTWSNSKAETDADLYGVWGSGATDVWAVGRAGTTLHFDGESWSEISQPALADLNDVWGSGPNDVWAVGEDGAILHWDGDAWSVAPNGGTR